ncbi:Meckelin [Paraphysoderma sedebokerense]|nr:Meckelin [Paraphysoderma sedebokerense]
MNLTVTFAEHGFKQGETNMLKFVLAKYALNGEFLGFEALTDQLQICEQTIPPTNAYLQIGANYKSGCLVNLYELLEKEKYKQTLFFDPYLVDSTNELYPIPVRIRNFRSRGDFPNLNADKDSIADDRFVRRFFTVDTASSAITEAGQPIVVRVAKTIRLRIEKSPTASSRINTPLIEITYAERQVSALSKSDSSSLSLIPIVFSTEYTMSVESLWSNLPTILLVISMVIVFGFFLRASFYFKRNHRGNVDINLKMAIQYLAMIASIAGPIFFLLLFGTSAYFAIFFKFQTVMYILLPESAGFTPFLNLLIASCVFQVFHVVKELVDQCSIDIFFIDWEKTRARVVSADNESKPAPVSIWRTLFMVNEWNELQTYRLVKVEMILFGMILILDYAGLRFAVASSRPSLMDSPADVNPILLFAVNTFTWGCLAAVLFIIKAGLIARYHSNPPLQYVDLLSVSNVSVLIFDEHHHGYYIHGRSVHGYADTDMITLNNDLKREETDLVGKRGLNGSENQVFEVFMAPDFRKTYDQIYNVMVGEESARKMLAKREKGEPLIKRIDGNKPQIASSKSLKAYEAINMFLCSFFDNHFRDHRYCVRERSYFDKLLQTVPDNFTETILYSGN